MKGTVHKTLALPQPTLVMSPWAAHLLFLLPGVLLGPRPFPVRPIVGAGLDMEPCATHPCTHLWRTHAHSTNKAVNKLRHTHTLTHAHSHQGIWGFQVGLDCKSMHSQTRFWHTNCLFGTASPRRELGGDGRRWCGPAGLLCPGTTPRCCAARGCGALRAGRGWWENFLRCETQATKTLTFGAGPKYPPWQRLVLAHSSWGLKLLSAKSAYGD